MSLTRLIESASELHQLANDAEYHAEVLDVARVSLNSETLTDREWREVCGTYARASADLNRINRRTSVLRGRIHFDAEVL